MNEFEYDDFAYLVERCFVEIATETVKARRMTYGAFAAMVWPDKTPQGATGRWNVIKGVASNTGVPQKLIFSDAVRIAEVLDIEFAYLALKAKDRATDRWEQIQAEKQAAEAQKNKTARGRRKLADRIAAKQRRVQTEKDTAAPKSKAASPGRKRSA